MLLPLFFLTSTASEPSEVLYGYWGLNGHWSEDELRAMRLETGMTVFQVANRHPQSALSTLLPDARAAGVKVTLRLTGDHIHYSRRGDFNLAAWKAMLAPWAGSGVQEYIDDGTLVGHMMLDDIHNFKGDDPTAAELDEMARYSKSILPGLMTYVRENATELPVPESGRYEHVDACVNQYRALDGDVVEYNRVEAARAAELGLGVINGLNIANGGDGSSGQPGWQKGRWAMSAEEIRTYGEVLAKEPSAAMFLNWEYDAEERWSDGSRGADYFDQPELHAALWEVRELVAIHPPQTLVTVPASDGTGEKAGLYEVCEE